MAFDVEDPAGIVGRRCRRPTFRCYQSMLKIQLSLLAVDLEDLPFVVSSSCWRLRFHCRQSMPLLHFSLFCTINSQHILKNI